MRKLSKSAQKETQQTGFERRIGHIADGHVDPRGFFQNAFFVAECIKALSAVVAAHAAAAHAAEAHAAGGQVNNGIVDAAAAEGDGGEHALLQRAVFGKQVQRQRMFAAVHKSERLVDGIIGDDGRTGPKISSCMTASPGVTQSRIVG